MKRLEQILEEHQAVIIIIQREKIKPETTACKIDEICRKIMNPSTLMIYDKKIKQLR
jgi:hypothetical protein